MAGPTKRSASSTSNIPSPPSPKRPRTEHHNTGLARPVQETSIFDSCVGLFREYFSSMGRNAHPQQQPTVRRPLALDAMGPPPMRGLEPNPGGSLALFGSTFTPRGTSSGTTSSQPIVIADDDGEDPQAMRRHEEQVNRRNQARQHLNDHVPQSTILKLFPSKFDPPPASSSSSSTQVNGVAKPPPQTPHNEPGPSRPRLPQRPIVEFKKPPRAYNWTGHRSVSPSSSSTDSTASGKVRRVNSQSNLRSRDGSAQQRMIYKRYQNLQAENSPNAPVFGRVLDDLNEATRKKERAAKRDTRTSLSGLAFHQQKSPSKPIDHVAKSFGQIQLDRRRHLDELVVPTPPKPAVAPIKPRPRPTLDFKAYSSEFVEKLEKQTKEEARRAKEKMRPRIPKHLLDEQEELVDDRLRDRTFEVTIGSAPVEASSLQRLKPETWLNDEIVNAYAELLNARYKAAGRKVHCMNSFFYQKLSEQGYEKANLKRWTKRAKVDIFELDQFLVPINVSNAHWVCASVNFAKKRIEYFDSLNDSGNRHKAFDYLRKYLQAEYKEKKGGTFDLSDWVDYYDPNTPKQNNSCDCGVFACQTLESIARGRDLKKAGFEFSKSNMPFFRRLMVLEIASGSLSERTWGNEQPKL